MSFMLKYNNVEKPSFMRVTAVDQELLPMITHYNSVIPNYYGNVDGGVALGSKKFKVKYKLIYDGEQDDSYYIDAMALWLTGDSHKVSKFQLDDSGEYYLARPTGVTNMDDVLVYGEGEIEFTASNPRRYAPTDTTASLAEGNNTINYTGIVPTCPVFYLTCSGTTSVKITNATNGDYVLVTGTITGNLVIDCNKKYISINGTKRMDLLDIKSDWITLFRGNNTLSIVVSGSTPTAMSCEYNIIK